MEDEPNPYAPVAMPEVKPETPGADLGLSESDFNKANAIMTDARQFWLGCILALICSLIASIVISIWYSYRLYQWKRLGDKYPILMSHDAPRRSFQAKFQAAQWKFIVGIVFGILVFFAMSYASFFAYRV